MNESERGAHNQEDAEFKKDVARCASEMLQSVRQWRKNHLEVGLQK